MTVPSLLLLASFPSSLRQIDADVHVERFQIDVDEGQYKDLLFLADGLSRFSRQSVHRHLRYMFTAAAHWCCDVMPLLS